VVVDQGMRDDFRPCHPPPAATRPYLIHPMQASVAAVHAHTANYYYMILTPTLLPLPHCLCLSLTISTHQPVVCSRSAMPLLDMGLKLELKLKPDLLLHISDHLSHPPPCTASHCCNTGQQPIFFLKC
jgi:hypothetical protein